jgi:hypothetical protein
MDDMPGTWRLAVKQAASLGGIGLLVGAAAGWVALLGSGDLSVQAARSAGAFRGLFVLLPAALLLWWWSGRQGAAVAGRPAPWRAATLSLVAGLVGASLASLAFVAVATQILTLFGGVDPGQFQGAVYPAIGWPAIGGLVALTTAIALGLALVGRGSRA